jgi:hypothetical protein
MTTRLLISSHSHGKRACRLRIDGTYGKGHYAVSPHSMWRFIVLDTFDVSIIRHASTDAERRLAEEFLHRGQEVRTCTGSTAAASAACRHTSGFLRWVAVHSDAMYACNPAANKPLLVSSMTVMCCVVVPTCGHGPVTSFQLLHQCVVSARLHLAHGC